jgi:hypothetical protein
MKVNVAAQTLSRRATAAIRTYNRLGMMDNGALHIAEFMKRVSDVFNLGNGVSSYDQDQKVSITKTNMAFKLSQMEEAIKWIAKWRFFCKFSHRHVFNIGWRVALALSAMLCVIPQLLEAGMNHVPPRRFTQARSY